MNASRKLNLSPKSEQIDVNEQSKDRVAPHCIGLATGLPPEQVLRLATELGYTHVIQKNGLEYAKELQTTEILVDNPTGFFNFPVASIFNPTDLSPEGDKKAILADTLFTSSAQKRDILDGFMKSMESRTLPRTLIEDITLVADEMFTNAVFNAPFVDKMTHENANVSRHSMEVSFNSNQPGRMLMAADETRIMIACEDPYGSLNLNGYLSRIKATYDRGAAATINFGAGGAGIGSYIIFNTSASLFVGVKAGRATIIACLLPLGLSNRKRSLLPKHLHWIQL
jgi:hypothetical protein